MDREFTVFGKECKLSKLTAMQQFHVLRRTGNIITGIIPAAMKFSNKKTDGKAEADASIDDQVEAIKPIILGIGSLSDQDSEFLLYTLLSAVEMKQGPAWAKVVVDGNLMFQNLDLNTMLNMAIRSFGYNFQSFLGGNP